MQEPSTSRTVGKYVSAPRSVFAVEPRLNEGDYINAESELGRTVFGVIPEGKTREFFCLRENVWIWYEDGITIRYELRDEGVFKRVGDQPNYRRVSGMELENFAEAVTAYLRLVKTRLYRI